VQGSFPGMLSQRRYELRLYGTWPPDSVVAEGAAIPYEQNGGWQGTTPTPGTNVMHASANRPALGPSWRYDGETTTTIITLVEHSTSQELDIRVTFPTRTSAQQALLIGLPGKISRLQAAMHLLEKSWDRGWAPDVLIGAAQTGHRVTLQPETVFGEYQKLADEWPDIVKSIESMEVEHRFTDPALAQLKSASVQN